MYMISTVVALKPGTADNCADLFKQTNPGLVRNQPDWLGAQMILDRQTNTVTVLATWKAVSAYEKMAASPAFQNTMQQFAAFFSAPPKVTINEVLVHMTPDSN